jgi:hypothetical protein
MTRAEQAVEVCRRLVEVYARGGEWEEVDDIQRLAAEVIERPPCEACGEPTPPEVESRDGDACSLCGGKLPPEEPPPLEPEPARVVKRTLIRDASVPEGQLAPMHVECECGARPVIERGGTTCACGIAYDAEGWIVRRPQAPGSGAERRGDFYVIPLCRWPARWYEPRGWWVRRDNAEAAAAAAAHEHGPGTVALVVEVLRVIVNVNGRIGDAPTVQGK